MKFKASRFSFGLRLSLVSLSKAKPSRPRARADTSFASCVPLKLTLCVSHHWSASREAEVPGTGCRHWHLDIYKRHSTKLNTTPPYKEICPLLAGNINVIPIKERTAVVLVKVSFYAVCPIATTYISDLWLQIHHDEDQKKNVHV